MRLIYKKSTKTNACIWKWTQKKCYNQKTAPLPWMSKTLRGAQIHPTWHFAAHKFQANPKNTQFFVLSKISCDSHAYFSPSSWLHVCEIWLKTFSFNKQIMFMREQIMLVLWASKLKITLKVHRRESRLSTSTSNLWRVKKIIINNLHKMHNYA